MTAEPSNASTERILHLLLLLLQGEHSRDEIFMRIPEYERGAQDASEVKMLERDLNTLDRAGIQVKRNAGRYSVPIEQFGRPALREYAHEDMQTSVWNAGILLWIPRQTMP